MFGFVPPQADPDNPTDAMQIAAQKALAAREGNPVEEGQAAGATEGSAIGGIPEQGNVSEPGGVEEGINAANRANEAAYNTATNVLIPRGGEPGEYHGGRFAEPIGGEEAFKNIKENTKQITGGLSEGAVAAIAEANAIAKQQLDSRIEQGIKYDEDETARKAERLHQEAMLNKLQTQLDAVAATKLDQGRIFENPLGFMGALLAAISPIIGAKDPMSGVNVINQAIQRDLDVQQNNLTNRRLGVESGKGLLADYMRITGDAEQARLRAEARMKGVAAAKLSEISMKYQGAKISADTQVKIGIFKKQENADLMRANALVWREPTLMTKSHIKALGPMPRPYSLAAQTAGDELAKQADQTMAGYGAGIAAGPSVGREAPQVQAPVKMSPVTNQGPTRANIITAAPTVIQSGKNYDVQALEESLPPYLKAASQMGRPNTGISGIDDGLRSLRAMEWKRAYTSHVNKGEDTNKAQANAMDDVIKMEKDAGEDNPVISGQMKDHAALNAAVADVQSAFTRVKKRLGSEQKFNEFMDGFRKYGSNADELARWLHNFNQSGGIQFGSPLSQAEANEYYGLMQKISYADLMSRHGISGSAVSPSENHNLTRFLDIEKMNGTSLAGAIDILSRSGQASFQNAVSAAKNPFSPYMWAIKHQNQYGRLSSK